MPLRNPNINPMFQGSGSLFALGTILQLEGGSPHSFGSDAWQSFGEHLVTVFKRHVEAAGLNEKIRGLAAAVEWMKSDAATAFFDNHIPPEGRGKDFVFIGDKEKA